MAAQRKSFGNWRTKSAYLSTCISVAMVIYVLGLMVFFLVKGQHLSKSIKQNFKYEIYIKDGIKEVEIFQFQKILDIENGVFKTIYKDKDAALKEYLEVIDPQEDFSMTQGYNPLPQNIEVFFHHNYSHPDSLKNFEQLLANSPIVSDFRYPKDLLYLVHQNLKKITIAFLLVAFLLLIVALALINNTIRLRVYNKRFVIRTMQLIGANHSFIRGPFLWNAVVMGIISGGLAVFALLGSVNLLYQYWPEAKTFLTQANDYKLYIAMVVFSILITWTSTLFAVQRFLKLKTDKLYY